MIVMINNVIHRLEGRSASELMRLTLLNARHSIKAMLPEARRRERAFRAFDERWGTDTFAIRELHTLAVDRSLATHARRYQASNGAGFPEWIASLGIDPTKHSFIDYGCGKGRAVFEAAQFPFARLIGVEFSAELVAIATANRDLIAAQNGLKAPVDIICQDAAQHIPPPGPLLCYFYDPFDVPIMAPVADRLALLDQPISIIYLEPNCINEFRRHKGWHEQEVAGAITLQNAAALAAY